MLQPISAPQHYWSRYIWIVNVISLLSIASSCAQIPAPEIKDKTSTTPHHRNTSIVEKEIPKTNSDSLSKTFSEENLHPQIKNESMQYGVLMQDGNMMNVQNGYLSLMKSNCTMNDGTKVSADGYLIKSNGAKIKLRDGDYVDITGYVLLTRVLKQAKK